ncbi:anthranilate phosphoribosyltransferase [Thermodesulfatator indicus DSM 15286]|uniref:Anthranilate phosphoribosyltransferase n=1 Tax=Thermodesulfatator indicus (strain DSM 15286 / JCM 11887 / CIR29812) TaxID=667014 RepID=F8AD89_THEID|nr:anthranilate phosphoribosyltransferase [Thermodesulfatator indicus]AEH44823.1 anthranilate phosphoribosyltransferase [Thermodesulfatator indicus DSM 15286]
MPKLKEVLLKAIEAKDLTPEEIEQAFSEVIAGDFDERQLAALLTALKIKGETWKEIAAVARTLRKVARSVPHNISKAEPLVDTCGTGGDRKGTFNVSTAAAFVVAAAGVKVAKHGNRSVSSKCGSADVLEALGVKIDMPPEMAAACLDTCGLCFLFAPLYHPAMKHVAPVRKALGFRTIFNLVGPLLNPAGANTQVLGVSDFRLTEKMAFALDALGARRALVVFGEDGYDEFVVTGSTKVSELRDGRITTYYVDPEDVGLELCEEPEELLGGDAEQNAEIIRNILVGKETGPKRDMVALNAGAAIYAAEKAIDLKAGVKKALEILTSEKAMDKLEELINFSQRHTQ